MDITCEEHSMFRELHHPLLPWLRENEDYMQMNTRVPPILIPSILLLPRLMLQTTLTNIRFTGSDVCEAR